MRRALSTIAVISALVVGVSAQARDTLTVLGRSDTDQPSQEVVAAVDDLAPGATSNWHRHPGTMVAFVSEGAVTVEQEGRPVTTFSAGESFIIPAGMAHNSVNNGATAARMFVSFIVPKGKPLSSPVRSSNQ